MPKLGLIAGNEAFPIHVARAAKMLGFQVVAVGLREETAPALEAEVDRMHWVSFSQIGQVPELLRKEGVRELVLAGQIKPERLLGAASDRLDGVTRGLIQRLPDRSGNSAMKMAVRTLESQGFRVLDSSRFLKEWIPAVGLLTHRAPSAEERQDLKVGLKFARTLARLGIGQTILVRQKAVVAVEGMEGTDATIRRAGQVAGPGCVVVKAAGPRQDMRFDIPVIGVKTLQAMRASGAGCLGVEARRTLLFDRPALIAQANGMDLAIVAL